MQVSGRLEHRQIIEAYSTIDEQAKIHGVALIPRISRNNNLYTKAELKRFDNVTVPLNWEHRPDKTIGKVTFHYNEDLETVYYEGVITDDAAANVARNKTLYTSIEADPTDMKEICNAPNDCFNMPFGLIPRKLALTETPGVPETTVTVIERYVTEIKECEIDKELERKYGREYNSNKEGADVCNPMDIILNRCEPYPDGSVPDPNKEVNDDCISRKIKTIKDEKPDMSQDQAVAIAISKCNSAELKHYISHTVFGLTEYCPDCGEKKKNK